MAAAQYRQQSEITRKFSSWVGERDDFAKVVAVVAELAADAIPKAQARIGGAAERAEHDKSWSSFDPDVIEEKWQTRLDERRRKIAESIETNVVMKHRRFSREVKGDPAAVLEAVEADDVVSAEIVAGSIYASEWTGGFGIRVEFTRADGCEFRAKGTDSNWIASVGGRLQEELSRRRPWYFWIRNWVVAYFICVLALAPFAAWVVVLTARWEATSLILVWTLAAWVILGLAAFGAALVRRLLPAFELLNSGRRARGAKVIGGVVAVVAWIAALVLPLILQGNG